jgi:aerobic-type carbon monoxide dehydrogenase small subunit (CoxS/CutS family)
MTQPVPVTLKVNDRALTATAAAADTLLTVLRDQFLLTGAKRGCNQGVCGACTVLADGRPVRSCLSLALDCDDRRI